MHLAERLQDAFDRGVNDDGASLPPEDVPFCLAWKFILDWEMGMLAGYFYNTLPDLAAIEEQGEALETVGLTDVARILRKGLGLFRDYKDPRSQRLGAMCWRSMTQRVPSRPLTMRSWPWTTAA